MEAKYKDLIRAGMIRELICLVTAGREDNDLVPYNQKQISELLTSKKSNIEAAVDEMYKAYKDDNELNDLHTAANDWFREFLYNHIDSYELCPCDELRD